MDIITQLSTLGLNGGVALDELPTHDIEGLEELQSAEGYSLFLQYLINLQVAVKPNQEAYLQQPVIQQSMLSQLKEGLFLGLDGQQLPLGGNQFPTASLASDPTQHRFPESLTSTGLPFIAAGSKPSETQFQDKIVDLQLSPPRVEQALGNRVLWMVGQNLQAAELRINPPQLGPLEVHISLEGQHTKVSFITHHAEVREMMESSIPRLRDILAESGLNSVNVDVSQQDLSQRRHGDSNDLLPAHGNLESSAKSKQGELQDKSEQWLKQGSGLVDYFA
jgi:hypothetical protein